jgi:hypothetical protein
MVRARDPFALALHTLRERASAGAFHPERPIVIRDEAQRLGLSPTPVREALAWLGGEGLVRRAAPSGYAGARLDLPGLRNRYRFRQNCLLLALDPAVIGCGAWPNDSPLRENGGAGEVFKQILERSGDDVLTTAYERVDQQLAALAPSEVRLLHDLEVEARELAEHLSRGDIAGLARALKHYHERRISMGLPLLLDLGRRAESASSRRPTERSP